MVAPPPDSTEAIGILPGPHLDRLPPGTFDRFVAASWTVSPAADRMGTPRFAVAAHQDVVVAVEDALVFDSAS